MRQIFITFRRLHFLWKCPVHQDFSSCGFINLKQGCCSLSVFHCLFGIFVCFCRRYWKEILQLLEKWIGSVAQSRCHLPHVEMEVIGAEVVSGYNLPGLAEAIYSPLVLLEFISTPANTTSPFAYSCPSRQATLYS